MTTNDEQYVPSDEDMRSVWVVHERDCGWEPHPGDPSAEFDRFLARVRRDAKAEGWQEGVNFALPGKETYWISKHNPHRATETGDSDEHR